MNINYDAGCIYDTLAFLSIYMDELAGKPNSRYQCPYYDEIKGLLREKQIAIYEYILPFVHKGNQSTSFLQNLIFNTSHHQKCTLDGLKQIINHNTYMKRKYVEFYFPNNLKIQMQQLISCNNPDVLMIIKESSLSEDLKIYILNTLFCFSVVAKSVLDSIQAVYPFFFEAQQFFIHQNFIDKLLKDDLILEKLYSITKLERGESFEFSFSLMESDLIFYHESEPQYLFLGCNFSNALDKKYKYCHVTPLLFAKGIGNKIKYDIFETLLQNQSLNIGELSTKLDYSRSELNYNLKEMQNVGLVIMEQVTGRQYFYKLDQDFLRTVNSQLIV